MTPLSIGAMYFHGLGALPRDLKKAFELYNQAAELGSKEAWKNLAYDFSIQFFFSSLRAAALNRSIFLGQCIYLGKVYQSPRKWQRIL